MYSQSQPVSRVASARNVIKNRSLSGKRKLTAALRVVRVECFIISRATVTDKPDVIVPVVHALLTDKAFAVPIKLGKKQFETQERIRLLKVHTGGIEEM